MQPATDRPNLPVLSKVLATVLIVAAAIVLYWPTWLSLADKWAFDSSSDSHGFPIALMSFVLLIQSVRSATLPDEKSGALMAGGLLIACAAWLAAYFSNVMVVQAAMLPIIFFFAFATAFGRRFAWMLIFPLGFFYFAVPVWNYLTEFLQALTVEMSGRILAMLRIPAVIEGSFVFVPSGTFEIAAGCAGLNFFIVALAIGSLYARQTLTSTVNRALFVTITIALAIIMNWLRVTTIVIAGYATEMQHYLVTVDHYTFGWVLFVVMLVPIFLLGRFLEKLEDRKRIAATTQQVEESHTPKRDVSLGRVGTTIVVLAVMPLLGMAIDHKTDSVQLAKIELPEAVGDWRWRISSIPAWQVQFSGAKDEIYGEYVQGGRKIELYANIYARQRQGAELISDSSSLFDRGVWQEHSRTSYALELLDGSKINVNTFEAVGPGGRRLQYVYWYLVADKALANAMQVKLYELRQRVTGRAASGIVAVKIACDLGCENGLERELTFLRSHAGEINGKMRAALAGSATLLAAVD